jgi:hypothetical protein
MRYREYAKKNDPTQTDAEIESAVGGLFGADAEIGEPIEYGETFTKYNVGGFMFYVNHSACDTVERVDENGDVIESWILDY